MRIFIPTINRQTKQHTAEALTAAGIDFTLVCSAEDTALSAYSLQPHVVCPVFGIRSVRQWILENSVDDKVLMLDDDLRFSVRSGLNGTFQEADYTLLPRMVDEIDKMLTTYAHGGIAPRFMGHVRQRGYEENTKYYHVLAYNRALFPTPPPKFRTEVGEDHDMNLQLLTRGKPNFVLTEWANDDKERASGGCQTWRTDDLEVREAKHLADLFPGLVRAEGRRVYVRWKQAAAQGAET